MKVSLVTFRHAYALAALAIFGMEVLIALFMHDRFVRPYVGDVLAVALVYTALRAITPLGLTPAITITLAIALAVETVQALNLLGALGLASNDLARTVLGGAFDWLDLAAYAAGALLVVAAERVLRR
jgi:hypothetical protein